MENYRLENRLGKGAQGQVFLAIDKSDGKKFVLKKVECTDETEATKAFKEAMALQELKHPYICGYKDFFVTWDKEEAAIIVCIVMDYYKMGDLDRLLKKKRKKNEAIEELILKKWCGQMIEALAFVHQRKVIHRDLKPSNIFLTDDLTLSLGDFGVATIMDDARTKARTTVGSMNWMAPEVLEKPYDERSDVWSLGCIILEMATCGFLDTQSMGEVLMGIKQDPARLEEALEPVGKTYSADLSQVIRTMLRRNFQQRPSALELVELPYIKECLALSNSALTGKKKEKEKAAKDCPTDKGIPGVMAFITENKDNEISITKAFKYLNTLQTPQIDEAGKKLIISSMKSSVSEVALQIEACRLLLTLTAAADAETDADDYLFSEEVIRAVILPMKAHPSSRDFQNIACSLLKTIALSEQAAGSIGKLGGIQDILSALRTHPSDAQVCANCCSALSYLTINDKNLDIMREEKGVVDLINAMESHETDSSVMDFTCSALWGLSLEDENVEMMAARGLAKVLLKAITDHKQHADVVKNGCMALSSLVAESEESAYLAHNSEGITIVAEAYQLHKENPDVVEYVCSFFMDLAETEDILEDMKSMSKVKDIIKEVKVKYASNEDIMGNVEMVDSMISGGQPPANRPSSARPKGK
ncbi:serine/threonine kinase-like domain-containing protein STKLD1 [Strongylocentrotus purpuratus]|uniref:non-specific serine/threonine protein kinase n=1 Tax=Strongylocentrotus purpuratus TaxID=7668 RepID=A0A7M7PPU3_STRPU|nr:serine/threonine kinase-like domain-containing protein STKLD1 [Strongylocentrotus purpuratus]